MSVPVALDELWTRVKEFGDRAFLVTVGADARPHVVSVAVRLDGDRLVAGAGSTTSANVAINPVVTLLWPPSTGGPYSLIVDGTASAADGTLAVEPSRAVLHRLAGEDESLPGCVRIVSG